MNKNIKRIMKELSNDEKIIDMHLVNICRRIDVYNKRSLKARELNTKGLLKPFCSLKKNNQNLDRDHILRRIHLCSCKEDVYNIVDLLDSMGDTVYNQFSVAIEKQLDKFDGRILKPMY